MKRIFFAVLLVLAIMFPTTASAENRTEYLLHASQKEIESIQKLFPHYTTSFDLIPMTEISLTKSEVVKIKAKHPEVEFYPVRDYEVAAVPESIPAQFELIKTKPEQTTPYTGKGVKVGIIDSGIDVNHEDLEVKGGVCTLEKDCPTTKPYHDDLGHGTHVAGIIAAQKNGVGIVGIAPNVELYSIKTINYRNSGTTTQIAAGVEWAIKNKIDVLNMSVTTKNDDPALKIMLDKAYQAGIILVAASGNEEVGGLRDTVQYPAKYPSVIAVSAIKQDKTRLFESSLGPEVELAAPGHNIVSTYPKELDTEDGKQDGYLQLQGTSMASPHVAGVAALLKERYPTLKNYEIRAILTNTAEDIGAIGLDKEFGYGLVQFTESVENSPIAVHYEERGKVIVEITNANLTNNRELQVNRETIQELSPGKWEFYKLSGDYSAELTYQTEGNTKMYPFVVHVDEPRYTDMAVERWYSNRIAYLAHNHRVFGYEDNTFRADAKIKRAEAVALLGRALGLDGTKRPVSFQDVGQNSFASGFIQSAVEEGYVTGFPDGTFRPDDFVTRGEMSILLQKAFKFPINASQMLNFTDMSAQVTSYDAVRALTQKGILQGYPDGKFKPNEPMTRATYSVFLAGAERPDLFQVK